jgi:hypothetical protein
MVQKTFGIYPETEDAAQLFIELGNTHVVCWTITSEQKVSSFEFFQCDDEVKTHLQEIFQQTKLYSKLLDGSYEKVSVVLDNECCLVLPQMNLSFDEKADLLQLAFGERSPNITKTNQPDTTYLYTISQKMKDLLNENFTNVSIQHKYEWLNNAAVNDDEQQLLLTCYFGHCIILLKKAGQLQLLQRYNYHTPEDVVYYVLNVCKQLNIELDQLTVTVQGLVAEDSELYAELYKYIPNVTLHKAENVQFSSAAFDEYPAHYFSSFFNAVA